LIAAFSSSVFSPAKASAFIKRGELSDPRQNRFAADAAAEVRGACVKKALAKGGLKLRTERRNLANEMNRSIESLDTIKSSLDQ
jgi:hypothetical protein